MDQISTKINNSISRAKETYLRRFLGIGYGKSEIIRKNGQNQVWKTNNSGKVVREILHSVCKETFILMFPEIMSLYVPAMQKLCK